VSSHIESNVPTFPIPEEIAEEGKRAADAGASILHIHARQDSGLPAYDIETYRKWRGVRQVVSFGIINYSTGAVGLSKKSHSSYHCAETRYGCAQHGSMNYAIYSPKTKSSITIFVFQNPFGEIKFYLEKMKEAGTVPEMEVFDNGHINNAMPLIDMEF